MDQAVRALAAVAAIAVAGNGIGLITDGDAMARLMGLPLVEETGLANQIANLGFFLFIGSAMAVTGAWIRSPIFFYCAAALIGCVLGFRLFATFAYTAPLSAGFVLVELIVLILWLAVGIYLQRQGGFILPAAEARQG